MSRRIRCIPLLARFSVPPSRLYEVLFRMSLVRFADALPPALLILWKVRVDTHLVPLAIKEHVTEAEIDEALDGFPKEIYESVLKWFHEERLPVQADATHRIGRRDALRRSELNMALVPFTGSCTSVKLRGRECWCGCWVLDGADVCEFCTDPAPTGPTSAVWIRGQCNEQQLEDIVERRAALEEIVEAARDEGIRIPFGCDPEKYISNMESTDYRPDEVSNELPG